MNASPAQKITAAQRERELRIANASLAMEFALCRGLFCGRNAEHWRAVRNAEIYRFECDTKAPA